MRHWLPGLALLLAASGRAHAQVLLRVETDAAIQGDDGTHALPRGSFVEEVKKYSDGSRAIRVHANLSGRLAAGTSVTTVVNPPERARQVGTSPWFLPPRRIVVRAPGGPNPVLSELEELLRDNPADLSDRLQDLMGKYSGKAGVDIP